MQTALMARMTSASPDALVLLDPAGTVLQWNDGAHRIYGYSADEAVGAQLSQLIVPRDHVEQQARYMADTLRSGAGTYESMRRRKDGSVVYVDVSTQRLDLEDQTQAILSAEKDVTTIKVLRDAKLMEARFRDLLESTPDGIVMANPSGHIVIANSQAERLFGYGPGELRGHGVDALLPQRYREALVGHRSNYFLQPRTRSMGSGLDLWGLRKDGSEFPIEISLSPLRTEESAFVMSAIRDISDRKRIERALQEKNLELASANQEKSRFLAGMSHELRTPLNAIIGFTGTLLMKLPGPLNTDQEKQLRTVQSSARHLLSLINDLLDVSRIDAGKVELKLESIDCRSLLQEILATLQPQARDKGLTLCLMLPEQPCVLTSDRRVLRQIVFNLAGNAIKFTEQGSVTLHLEARERDGRPVTEIRVDDTDIGMAPADQARLFAALTRVRDARPNAAEGTGLDLHLSRRLAELLGGRITLRSEPGRGSSFALLIGDGG